MPKRIAFITPAAPVLKREPPVGPQWVHEVKFDGWRMQLHKAGDRVVIFSRNGVDMTSRFGMIGDKALSLRAGKVIIEASDRRSPIRHRGFGIHCPRWWNGAVLLGVAGLPPQPFSH